MLAPRGQSAENARRVNLRRGQVINKGRSGTEPLPTVLDPTWPDFSDLTNRMYRLCLAMLADRADAEEAAQEALTRAWSRRGAKRPDVSWWSFAAGFALRVCRETRRGRRNHESFDVGQPRGLEPVAQGVDDAFSEGGEGSRGLRPAAREEIGGALHRAIAGLPPRQREVVVLRFLMSMSTEQAAETLAVAPGTVKSNLFKAMRSLRDVLGSHERTHELLGL